MSKILKRLLLILIVLISIIFVLPKLEHAVVIDIGCDDGSGFGSGASCKVDTATYNEWYEGNQIGVYGTRIFQNNQTFCLEKTQDFADTFKATYKLEKIYSFDSTTASSNNDDKFLNGLAYILSNCGKYRR